MNNLRLLINFLDENINCIKTEISDADSRKRLKYKRLGRHYLADHVSKEVNHVILTAAAYHAQNRILVVGFNNGEFFLYELPSINIIHSLRYYFLLI